MVRPHPASLGRAWSWSFLTRIAVILRELTALCTDPPGNMRVSGSEDLACTQSGENITDRQNAKVVVLVTAGAGVYAERPIDLKVDLSTTSFARRGFRGHGR